MLIQPKHKVNTYVRLQTNTCSQIQLLVTSLSTYDFHVVVHCSFLFQFTYNAHSSITEGQLSKSQRFLLLRFSIFHTLWRASLFQFRNSLKLLVGSLMFDYSTSTYQKTKKTVLSSKNHASIFITCYPRRE